MSSVQPAEITWGLTIRRGRRCYLHELPLLLTDPAPTIMAKVQDATHSARLFHGRVEKLAFFRSETVSVTTLSPIYAYHLGLKFSLSAMESAKYPQEVFPEAIHFSAVLTAAFHRPSVLPISSSFTAANASNASFAIACAEGPKQSLLIDYRINTLGWICVVVGIVFPGVAVGLVVGLVQHNASLGLAATSGVAAVIGGIEALMLWLWK